MTSSLPQEPPTLHDILTAETLAYGKAVMDFKQLRDWIAGIQILGTFSKGRHELDMHGATFNKESLDAFNAYVYCPSYCAQIQEYLNDLGQEASKSSRTVSDFASYISQHFTNVAKVLAKNKELLIQLLVGFAGKTYRAAAKEVDHVVKVWQFWSVNPDWAESLPTANVCGGVVWITGNYRDTLLEISLQICKHLAQGNAVILSFGKAYHPLLLCLAELCTEAKLPHDLVNVVCFGNNAIISSFVCSNASSLRSILFVEGSDKPEQAKLKTLRETMGIECFLVYDSGDINCAIEAIISYMQASDLTTGLPVCLLVQSSVWEQFLERLKVRMAKLIVGSVLDKNTDIRSPACFASLPLLYQEMLAIFAKKTGIEVVSPGNAELAGPPLIIGAQPATQVFSIACGPIMVAYPFRTHKESLSLANTLSNIETACVFTENLSLAMSVAPQINAKVVCVNGYGFLYEGMELNDASISIVGKYDVAKTDCTPQALSKDLYKVIDSSKTAQKAWTAMSSLSRAVIFRDLIHMLEQKISSIAAKIGDLGDSKVGAENGIKLSIDNLGLRLKEKQVEGTILGSGDFRGTILQTRQPRGLILAIVSEIETPVQTILGLVSQCLLQGNALLLIPVSEQSRVIVSELVACLTACRLPANLVRVLNFDASNVEQNVLNLLVNGSMNALISLGHTYQIVNIKEVVCDKGIPGYINASNFNSVVSQTFKEQTGYPKYCFIPSGDNFGN